MQVDRKVLYYSDSPDRNPAVPSPFLLRVHIPRVLLRGDGGRGHGGYDDDHGYDDRACDARGLFPPMPNSRGPTQA